MKQAKAMPVSFKNRQGLPSLFACRDSVASEMPTMPLGIFARRLEI